MYMYICDSTAERSSTNNGNRPLEVRWFAYLHSERIWALEDELVMVVKDIPESLQQCKSKGKHHTQSVTQTLTPLGTLVMPLFCKACGCLKYLHSLS